MRWQFFATLRPRLPKVGDLGQANAIAHEERLLTNGN